MKEQVGQMASFIGQPSVNELQREHGYGGRSRSLGHWRRSAGIAAAALSLAITLATVAAAPTASAATVTRLSETTTWGPIHHDAEPGLPCTTADNSSGTTRSNWVLVDGGDGLIHVTYHENYSFITVPDDPSLPTLTHRGTETLSFTATRGGTTSLTDRVSEVARGGGEWLKVEFVQHLTVVDNAPPGPSGNDVVRTELEQVRFVCSYA
jgi:hypothetical protein